MGGGDSSLWGDGKQKDGLLEVETVEAQRSESIWSEGKRVSDHSSVSGCPPSRFYSFIPLCRCPSGSCRIYHCLLIATNRASPPLPYPTRAWTISYFTHISSLGTTWVFIQNAVSGPTPDLSNQNLRFNRIPRRLTCTLQIEKHWSRLFIYHRASYPIRR